jgi:predicted lipid-binding transport protein (Tim44 family)
MPRRRRGFFKARKQAPPPMQKKQAPPPMQKKQAPPPMQKKQAPPPMQKKQAPQAQGPGLVGSMAQGAAMGVGLGAGSEIAHQAVGSLFSGNSVEQPVSYNEQNPPVQATDTCRRMQEQLVECLKVSNECSFLVEHMRDVCKN